MTTSEVNAASVLDAAGVPVLGMLAGTFSVIQNNSLDIQCIDARLVTATSSPGMCMRSAAHEHGSIFTQPIRSSSLSHCVAITTVYTCDLLSIQFWE